jgi:CRP/FNR family transcriptional regulator, cyclic AMP receptor protein
VEIMPHEVLAKISDFPMRSFAAGEVVLHAGSETGQLLFLKEGAVDVVLEDAHLASVAEPGAVFGDMAFFLGRPHTADVVAGQAASLYVVEDPEALLRREPVVALYVARVLAERLNAVNHLLVEGQRRAAEAGQRRGLLMETLNRVGQALQIGVPT